MRRPLLGVAGLLIVVLGLSSPGLATAQAEAKTTSHADDKAMVVTLRPETVVEDPIVTVGAVATVEGGTLGMRQRIETLDVAEVSQVGRTVAISREQVVYRIQLAGIDAQTFRLEGAAQALVKMTTVELTQEEVVKAAQQAILERSPENSKDTEFRVLEDVRLPALTIAAEDCVRLTAGPLPATLTPGKVRVDVAIEVNGERRGVAAVVMDMLVYRRAAITARRLEAGEVLAAEHLRLERRLFHATDPWLAYTDQLLGKKVLHALPAGRALTPGDLDLPAAEEEVLIHVRDNVKLVANVGNLRISAVGEALQDGKSGQVIRVRNTDSGKIVVGRVIGRSTIEVEY